MNETSLRNSLNVIAYKGARVNAHCAPHSFSSFRLSRTLCTDTRAHTCHAISLNSANSCVPCLCTLYSIAGLATNVRFIDWASITCVDLILILQF